MHILIKSRTFARSFRAEDAYIRDAREKDIVVFRRLGLPKHSQSVTITEPNSTPFPSDVIRPFGLGSVVFRYTCVGFTAKMQKKLKILLENLRMSKKNCTFAS